MNRRTINLIERRPRRVRLPHSEVQFLLAHARNVIELIPRFKPNTYVLVPRGSVGFLDGPTTRYAIQPKLPWPNLRLLLGLADNPGGESVDPEGGLLAALATEFADRLETVIRTGLIAGYCETESIAPYLRGRLRAAHQMRDAASRPFLDRFHIDEPVFDLNTPWNRVVRTIAAALLGSPGLPKAVALRLANLMQPLTNVPDGPITDNDITAAFAEPRALHYRQLLELCRIIQNGFVATKPLGARPNSFLIDLETAFEHYLANSLAQEFKTRPQWRVEVQPQLTLGPAKLCPDLVIRFNGEPHTVLDAKWKQFTRNAADLHQVLAYAVLTGAPRVGLVYPGRTDRCQRFVTPNGRLMVFRYRLRVVGTVTELAASVAKLAQVLQDTTFRV